MIDPYSFDAIEGIDYQRAPAISEILSITKGKVPGFFPNLLWQRQTWRYFHYWNWWTGRALNERLDVGKESERDRFPLKINLVRTFARKKAHVLIGEPADGSLPPVKAIVVPRPSVTQVNTITEVDEDTQRLAQLCQNILNAIWIQSNGKTIQMENAVMQQFLGGSVWQVKWDASKEDECELPIFFRHMPVDFFIPVFDPDDYFNLLECFVVYRITNQEAALKYGLTNLPQTGFSVYVEHWTREFYSIYVNGSTVNGVLAGQQIAFDQVENPFGFVPFVYAPTERAGGPYGHSMVEDIASMTIEYNARMADMGDAISDSVHRQVWARDLPQGKVEPLMLENGLEVLYLGQTRPSMSPPEVGTIDPPVIPEGVTDFTRQLFDQILRDGGIGAVAFGEDEGSQRSALTLAFRMYPLTSNARQQRAHWDTALNRLCWMALKMVQVKQPSKIALPKDVFQRVIISQDWSPQIPRDREQELTEVITRYTGGLMSLEAALERLGDVRDIHTEINRIKDTMKFKAELAAKPEPGAGRESPAKMPQASIAQT